MQDIANLIPAKERKEILEDNVIALAQPYASDPNMHHLGVVWKMYIEPSLSMDCGMCVGRVLNNWRELQPLLVQMQKDSNLLDTA